MHLSEELLVLLCQTAAAVARERSSRGNGGNKELHRGSDDDDDDDDAAGETLYGTFSLSGLLLLLSSSPSLFLPSTDSPSRRVASLSCRVLHNIYVRISRLHSNDSDGRGEGRKAALRFVSNRDDITHDDGIRLPTKPLLALHSQCTLTTFRLRRAVPED